MIMVQIQTIYSAHISTLLGAKPLVFHYYKVSCVILRALHNTRDLQLYVPSEGTKQLWLSVLLKYTSAATGQAGDSNPHSDNARTWVQRTRPLGHDTMNDKWSQIKLMMVSNIPWNIAVLGDITLVHLIKLFCKWFVLSSGSINSTFQ